MSFIYDARYAFLDEDNVGTEVVDMVSLSSLSGCPEL